MHKQDNAAVPSSLLSSCSACCLPRRMSCVLIKVCVRAPNGHIDGAFKCAPRGMIDIKYRFTHYAPFIYLEQLRTCALYVRMSPNAFQLTGQSMSDTAVRS